MPRTAIPVTTLGPNTAVVDPAAGDTIDAALVTNGAVVLASDCPLEELVVVVEQTAVAGAAVTINPGTSPPALSAGQGDITQVLAQNEVGWFGPFTSARFMSAADGTDPSGLWVDFGAGATGSIWAYRVPRTA